MGERTNHASWAGMVTLEYGGHSVHVPAKDHIVNSVILPWLTTGTFRSIDHLFEEYCS